MKQLFIIITILVAQIIPFKSRAQESKQLENKISGEATLMSQWIDHGLKQTNGDPCIQTSLWFHFGPQFKLGFQGANLSNPEFPGTHVVIKGAAELKVTTGAQSYLAIQYSNNKFFKDSILDGTTTGFLLDIMGYRFLYQGESNWQGSEWTSKHYTFSKSFDILSGYSWYNHIGWTDLSDVLLPNYADIKSALGTKQGIAYYEGAITLTSQQAKTGRGGLNAFLSAKIDF